MNKKLFTLFLLVLTALAAAGVLRWAETPPPRTSGPPAQAAMAPGTAAPEGPETPSQGHAEAPSPAAEPSRLYYLGDRNTPLSAALYGPLAALAEEEGWTFTAYDCAGRAKGQKGQALDALRDGPGVAVLYPLGEQEQVDEIVETLGAKGFQVVTLGRLPSAAVAKYVPCRVTWEEDALLDALLDLVTKQVKKGQKYSLLIDFWPDMREMTIREALEEAGCLFQTSLYTGGKRSIAKEVGTQGFADFPVQDFALALNPEAALGLTDAAEAAGKTLSVYSLGLGPQALQVMAEGRAIAGGVMISPGQVTEVLREALPQVQAGKWPGLKTLTPLTVTPAQASDVLKQFS